MSTMLMFIFGAGATFDSDPERRDPGADQRESFRPPLATGLFDPKNAVGKEIIAKFPRAAPLIMRLRDATRQGADIEEALEHIQVSSERYPETMVQLLAFRAYLAELMQRIPDAWLSQCQGLTNYVLALSQADEWNKVSHADGRDPIATVTFNYDSMLERAVQSVFGHNISQVSHYVAHTDVRVYKPHGSVNWQTKARWDWPPGNHLSRAVQLPKAIDQANSLRWSDEFRYETGGSYQDQRDTQMVWLPALSVPVRYKSDFTMPSEHSESLKEDLRKVTTLIAVGWRAREHHFLKLLQEHLGSGFVRLVAVAENDENAQETTDNLWQVGRFNRFALSGIGFSGFAARPGRDYIRLPDPENHTRLTLHHVLTAGEHSPVWTKREPAHEPMLEPEAGKYADPGYADL